MSKFIIGAKQQMSRLFRTDGTVIPVTVLNCGQCIVTQIKTVAADGYHAVQVGFGTKRKKGSSVDQSNSSLTQAKVRREFRVDSGALVVGQMLEVTQFAPGDMVDAIGVSKGKGFQGVVRRHGFHGHPSTHGHKDQERMPGSIGAGGRQHVAKGRRMAGRMGNDQVTVHNLEVVEVRPEKNELLVKGAVPGARNGIVLIRSIG